MSDDFVPLNQSTPVQRQWNQGKNLNPSGISGFRNNHFQNGRGWGGMNHGNKWGNNSRNNSYSSDNNSYSNNSYKKSIDAYLHPSMLEDPWAQLRQKKN